MVADLFDGRNFVEFEAIETLLECDRSFLFSIKPELELLLKGRYSSDCDLTALLDAEPPGFFVDG